MAYRTNKPHKWDEDGEYCSSKLIRKCWTLHLWNQMIVHSYIYTHINDWPYTYIYSKVVCICGLINFQSNVSSWNCYVCTYICSYVCKCISNVLLLHMYVCNTYFVLCITYIHECMCVYVLCMCVYVYIVYVCMFMFCVYMCVYVCAFMYVCMYYVCVFMYYVCTYVAMHVFAYEWMQLTM